MTNEQADENGIDSEACKTAFRPYDLALTAFLLIAQHHLGSEKVVRSDGEQAQWEDAPGSARSSLAMARSTASLQIANASFLSQLSLNP